MATRPSYLYPGGSVMMHSPLQLKNSDMYGYFVKGDVAKLQHTLDSTLNTVAGQRMRFKALSPYVMITFTRVNHADSAVPVDHAKGWITEIDIVTWVMTGAMDKDGKLEHIYWYPCHIFVDDAMALVNGRELFGYPKYLCEYDIPHDGQPPLRCSVAAKGFKQFSPETRIALHPLLEVNAVNPNGNEKVLDDLGDLIEEAIELFLSVPDFFNMDKEGWEDIVSLLRNPRIDQIFLKQFPDSAGIKAVYQAIVAAPATIDKLHSVTLLGYDYEATLHAFDSFPLNDTLGLQLGRQAAILPFHVNFDFTAQPGEELVDNSQVNPSKIAILGGGVGAMTTAYYLTSQPGWQNNVDITVYQQGWRLGGKGASGRNAELGQRIEEHGLHIWFGFYANAFKMIREAYAALDRPPGSPLATWEDAFKQHDYVALSEDVNGERRNWSIVFPPLPGEPGTGTEEITLWQMAVAMIAWIEQWLKQLRDIASDLEEKHAPEHASGIGGWLRRLADEVTDDIADLAQDVAVAAGALAALVANLSPDSATHSQSEHDMLAGTLGGIRQWVHARYREKIIGNDDLRRMFICLDLGITVMKGMFEDGVFRHGFDVINDIDFRDWLRKHGGDEEYCVNSAPVWGFYDLVFAYENGDFGKPNVEAGTILRSMMRIGLAYKGGIMFKMQAGMGDTIFTPLYEVLKARGVKFKFFHKVDELVPDGDTIASIRMTRQVELAHGDYQPLVDVKGLACWPSAPLYGQIDPAQAALLQQQNVNLESYWTNWDELYREAFGQPLPSVTLKKGVDFDQVVFGISIGSLPALCPQLLAKSAKLRTASEKVQTVATQAYQVWLNKDLAQMGWTHQPQGQQPVLSGFTEPYDTWAPMDQLLCREAWPPAIDPKNVSYFCSALPVASYPPPSDHAFPDTMKAVAKEGAVGQLRNSIAWLWPSAGPSGAFPWNWLVDPAEGTGEARFDAQYWRANVDPSERYVMSVVNSTKYRLATDESGFDNLFLTGDWIKTGLNAGCVEAAVMAGMQTSRAMTGYPQVIQGEKDF
ncbi:NAD(P)-binding protein [Pseudoduganella ginsengisoli]|uniref:NAD(P)-binding protein n=1 Tax=Pseudoduganella ginsengisoli TaxID=1462440 RepID=A0A6L6PW14_9BURK|nr:NAD(P)-binding protein [Pseudoduganella ginsengisoli]MTW01401.1 NAD(P)-binding protein [Pseudoduganella ginsengisoli]